MRDGVDEGGVRVRFGRLKGERALARRMSKGETDVRAANVTEKRRMRKEQRKRP